MYYALQAASVVVGHRQRPPPAWRATQIRMLAPATAPPARVLLYDFRPYLRSACMCGRRDGAGKRAHERARSLPLPPPVVMRRSADATALCWLAPGSVRCMGRSGGMPPLMLHERKAAACPVHRRAARRRGTSTPLPRRRRHQAGRLASWPHSHAFAQPIGRPARPRRSPSESNPTNMPWALLEYLIAFLLQVRGDQRSC